MEFNFLGLSSSGMELTDGALKGEQTYAKSKYFITNVNKVIQK